MNKGLKEEKKQALHISEGRSFQAEGSASVKNLPAVVVNVYSWKSKGHEAGVE